MDCLYITNWDRLYEVNSSNNTWKPGDRKRNGALPYVRTPTYGTAWPRTYRELLRTAEQMQKSAAVAMGVFSMLKQIAANHSADYRGYIIDGQCSPYSIEELAEATGFSPQDTTDGLSVLMNAKWIMIRKVPQNMADLIMREESPDFSLISLNSLNSGKSLNSKISLNSSNSRSIHNNTKQGIQEKTYHKNDTTQKASFDDWIYEITNSNNKVATFVDMIGSLYGEERKPTFARLGSLRKRINDDRRLAQLLWENATRPPAGDVCNFIEAAAKSGKKYSGAKKKVNYEEGF